MRRYLEAETTAAAKWRRDGGLSHVNKSSQDRRFPGGLDDNVQHRLLMPSEPSSRRVGVTQVVCNDAENTETGSC